MVREAKGTAWNSFLSKGAQTDGRPLYGLFFRLFVSKLIQRPQFLTKIHTNNDSNFAVEMSINEHLVVLALLFADNFNYWFFISNKLINLKKAWLGYLTQVSGVGG